MDMIKTYTVLSIADMKRMIRAIRKARPGCKDSATGVLYSKAQPAEYRRNGEIIHQVPATTSSAVFEV